MRPSFILELEAKFVGAGLQRLQLFIKEGTLTGRFRIVAALFLQFIRLFLLEIELRVARADQGERLAIGLGPLIHSGFTQP